MEPDTQILIAARPGIMRNSLLSYVRTIPTVRHVLLADDIDMARHAVSANKPRLALVDADLTERGMLTLVQWIRTQQPATRLILLVESIRQQELLLAQGADFALLKGFLDESLRKAVMDVIGKVEHNHVENA